MLLKAAALTGYFAALIAMMFYCSTAVVLFHCILWLVVAVEMCLVFHETISNE